MQNTAKVLLADANEEFRALLAGAIGKTGEFTVVGSTGDGLEALRLRPVDELSGGELQKVMLARALVQQPKVLLLDEPTSNLDPRNQYEMMKLVHTVADEKNITVLVVIHDLSLALRFCDRFLLMKDGSVYASGDSSVLTDGNIYPVYGMHAYIETVHGVSVVVMLEDGDVD